MTGREILDMWTMYAEDGRRLYIEIGEMRREK
jgi:hypothetical protein